MNPESDFFASPPSKEPSELSDHELLHRLWSKAVDASNYVKEEWIELERRLLKTATKPAS